MSSNYNLRIFKDNNSIYKHILNNNNIEGKVLLLSTGSTPLGLYSEMVSRKLDFSNIITFNLDEYYPINKENPKSYFHYMWSNLFQHITNTTSERSMKKDNIYLLNGNIENTELECMQYSNLIQENPIDIAFLGIGVNGHIAFNEPGSSQYSKTRLVELTKSTQSINNVDYMYALTIGMSEILSSKKNILMAVGENKSDIIYDLINMYTPVQSIFSIKNNKVVECIKRNYYKVVDYLFGIARYNIPAAYLLEHNNLDIYVDEMAFSKVLQNVSKEFNQYNKILIFSPHPDDDANG